MSTTKLDWHRVDKGAELPDDEREVLVALKNGAVMRGSVTDVCTYNDETDDCEYVRELWVEAYHRESTDEPDSPVVAWAEWPDHPDEEESDD